MKTTTVYLVTLAVTLIVFLVGTANSNSTHQSESIFINEDDNYRNSVFQNQNDNLDAFIEIGTVAGYTAGEFPFHNYFKNSRS